MFSAFNPSKCTHLDGLNGLNGLNFMGPLKMCCVFLSSVS